jgi:hypothetical protein
MKLNFSQYESTTLKKLNSVQLLNRNDTKFIFHQNNLPHILEKLSPFYKILKIDDTYTFSYDNHYFDTEDFLFYHQHHNEKRNRYKVRYRSYSTTGEIFFEIKTKNNKNRTLKKRFPVEEWNQDLGKKEYKFITNNIDISPQSLKSILNIQFKRITLVDKNFTERLTIDMQLSIKNGKNSKKFDNLIITEIKQNKYNVKSKFIQILRDIKISEMRFSKYCIGIISVNNDIKKNRFKPKLLQLNKILNHD